MSESRFVKALRSLGFQKYDLSKVVGRISAVEFDVERENEVVARDDKRVVPMILDSEPRFFSIGIDELMVTIAVDDAGETWKYSGTNVIDLEPHGFTAMFKPVLAN